jgi:Secretion system C-terminal sorting domain
MTVFVIKNKKMVIGKSSALHRDFSVVELIKTYLKSLIMHIKKNYLNASALLLLLISAPISAQTSLTDAYFPSVNDSLQTAIALPQYTRALRLTSAASAAQQWDFSFLRSANNSTAKTTERYLSTTDTALLRQFPTAKLVRDIGGGQLAAYNKTATRFELLGYKNIDLGGALRLPLIAKFLQPVLERRAPLAFNTTNRNQSNFVLAFSSDIIPDTILSSLPIRPDSIRIRFQTDRQDKTDAFGTLSIPGGRYEVIRERRYEITDTKIEARINPLPWLDITALVLTGQQRPRDTTIRYYFWSNLAKEPIAILTADDRDSVVLAEYKYLKINTSVKNTPNTEGGDALSIFPNPTTNNVFFDVKMLSPTATFSLAIVDNMGRKVAHKKVATDGEQRVQMDASKWLTGIYWVYLTDAEGRIWATKSFVKN